MTQLADGRRLRSERTRAAIVEAMLELIREGTARPSAQEIAVRARVTQRTLFNHFTDMGELLSAVVSSQIERVGTLFPEPPSADLDLVERARAIAAGFADLNEDIEPVRWSALTFPTETPAILLGIVEVRQRVSDLMEKAFTAELGNAPNGHVRNRILGEMELAADPVAWRLRRRQQGLDKHTATAHLAETLAALAGSASGERESR